MDNPLGRARYYLEQESHPEYNANIASAYALYAIASAFTGMQAQIERLLTLLDRPSGGCCNRVGLEADGSPAREEGVSSG